MLDIRKDILDFCATNNSDSFNYNKAVEELIELQEVLVKRQTKHKYNPKRPDKQELIKEFGDVIYRNLIVLMQDFPELDTDTIMYHVQEYINYKLMKLEEYKKEGKYKGGL